MKEIVVKASVDTIQTVTEFIDELLESYECAMRAQTQIDVVIDEVLSNITFYAYENDPGNVKVQIEYDQKDTVTLTFIDSGIPFNPLEKEDPDINQDARVRQIGGLGIFIVKKFMDMASYEYKDDCNILKLQKKIK